MPKSSKYRPPKTFISAAGDASTRLLREQDRIAKALRRAIPGRERGALDGRGHAVGLGLSEVKFFPAGLLGGPAAIRALTAPFTEMSFMPSGGVSADNLTDYLAIPAVPAVSGSWMVAENLLAEGRWDEVTRRSAAAVTAARQTRGSSLTSV